jgi:hypothetical protein
MRAQAEEGTARDGADRAFGFPLTFLDSGGKRDYFVLSQLRIIKA